MRKLPFSPRLAGALGAIVLGAGGFIASQGAAHADPLVTTEISAGATTSVDTGVTGPFLSLGLITTSSTAVDTSVDTDADSLIAGVTSALGVDLSASSDELETAAELGVTGGLGDETALSGFTDTLDELASGVTGDLG